MNLRNKKSFTLIEATMAMIIMAVTLTPFSILIATVMAQQSGFSQAQATAVALAEGKMEETTAERFSLITAVASTAFAAPFTNYAYQVVVDNVAAGALNTPVTPGTTEYKRVQVKVTNNMTGTITLTTVMANDW